MILNSLAQGIIRSAEGAPSLTLPTTNLLAAWDARAGVGSVDGGITCSAWADQSGNGWNASQGTSGKRPTISSTGGFPSLLFNGTNSALKVDGIVSSPGTKTVYAVQDAVTVTGGYRMLFDTINSRFACGHMSGNEYGIFGNVDNNSGIAASTGLSRLAFQASSGASRVWRNGTAGTARSFPWNPHLQVGTVTGIGAQYAGASFFFHGHILFLAIYNDARNTDVEDYITQEWGV